jgi:hypothetical protein
MFSVDNFDLIDYSEKFYKIILLDFILFLIRVIVSGLILMFCFSKVGVSNFDIKSYMLYFLLGGAVTYILAFMYFMYKCVKNGKHVSKLNYKNYFWSALIGPIAILIQIAILIFTNSVKHTPVIGNILYFLSWSSFGLVWVSGIAFSFLLDREYHNISCTP